MAGPEPSPAVSIRLGKLAFLQSLANVSACLGVLGLTLGASFGLIVVAGPGSRRRLRRLLLGSTASLVLGLAAGAGSSVAVAWQRVGAQDLTLASLMHAYVWGLLGTALGWTTSLAVATGGSTCRLTRGGLLGGALGGGFYPLGAAALFPSFYVEPIVPNTLPIQLFWLVLGVAAVSVAMSFVALRSTPARAKRTGPPSSMLDQLMILRRIVVKELREVVRDHRLCLALAVLASWLALILALSAVESWRFAERHRANQAEARRNWLDQGDRGAHSAAHHGTYLFKPKPPLAFFDPGLDPYLGTTLRVEAHHQHRLANTPAQDASDLIRFDASTGALMLQVVFPLLAILLGFSALTRERERGTLALLLGMGLSGRTLILGKALAILIVLGVVVSPLAVYFGWALAVATRDASRLDVAMRELFLASAYFAYLAGWVFLAIAASAWSRSTRLALVLLLAAWGTGTLLVPRLATDLARRREALPTQEEFERWNRDALRTKDGRSKVREMTKALETKLLKQHGVKRKEDLPVNFAGLSMQAAEELTDAIHEENNARLAAILDRQDRLAGRFAPLSPLMAIRLTSMALAGSDRHHHEAFDAAAEAYRRLLVRTLNAADSVRPQERDGEKGPVPRGRALWEAVPEFRYRAPDWSQALREAAPGLTFLGVWAGLAVALALTLSTRLRLDRGR